MESKDRFFRILSVVSILSLLMAFLAHPAHQPVRAASTIIDSFTDTNTIAHAGSVGSTSLSFTSTELGSTSVLGNVRKVKLDQTVSSGTTGINATTTGNSAGKMAFSTDDGNLGTLYLAYDGTPQAPGVYTLNTRGLSGVDLTDGGNDTSLNIIVLSTDFSMNITVNIYSPDSNPLLDDCSTLTLKTPTLHQSTQLPVVLAFPFINNSTHFVKGGTCNLAADFSKVSAVEIVVSALALGSDTSIRLISTGKVDYGDAYIDQYDFYNTILTDQGDGTSLVAGHLVDPALRLGSMIDGEFDGQPNATATGDDINGLAPDDEDGVFLSNSPWTKGNAAGGRVTVDVVGNGCLSGWIDWTANGLFENSTTVTGLMNRDRIINNYLVTGGRYNIPFAVPTAAPNFVNARFRLFPRDLDNTCTSTKYPDSNDGVVSGAGVGVVSIGGEVEDYRWEIDKTTAVNVTNYQANLAQPFGLQLQWTTVMETNTAGFNLYRAKQPDGIYTKINSTLIPAQTPGESGGNEYTYIDTTALPGVEYSYQLEHVAADMSTSDYGVTTGVYYMIHIPMMAR